MKKLLLTLLAILGIAPAFADNRNAELEEYLPVAQKLYDGKTVEALQMAEKLSPRNHFASILLYLVYSRGYCGQSIDYPKTAKYFDRMLAGYSDSFPGSRFHSEEFRDVWRNMLVPPVGNQRTITLKTWNYQGRVINQKINLKGKQPLKNCYFEKTRIMGNIAGASIWAAMSRSNPDRGEWGEHLRKTAVKFGSIDALFGITYSNFDHYSIDYISIGSNYTDINKAAEAGHIPAKIMIAAILLTPGNKYNNYDPGKAYKMLKSVIKELEAYEPTPCKHHRSDLKNARYLLSLLPDPALATEKLASLYNAGADRRKAAAYLKMIAGRNDHPVCELFKIFQLPLKDQDEALKKAAERGNPEIIALLLRRKTNQPDYWKYLYLAGKHNIDKKYNPHPERTFYSQSLGALSIINMGHEEFRKALKQLAGVYPQAREEYILRYGSDADNSSERFRFEVSNPEAIKVTRENTPVGNFYILEIKQDTQQNYVDIFIKPGRFNFVIMPHYANGKSFPMPNSSDIWTFIKYPDGNFSTHNGMGSNTYGKCPERIRINIESGSKKGFLKIRL